MIICGTCVRQLQVLMIQQQSRVSVQHIEADSTTTHVYYLFLYSIQTANSLVLHVRFLWMLGCGSWMLSKSVTKTFASPIKLTFSLDRTDAFEEQKIPMLQYHHPWVAPIIMAWMTISFKKLTGSFFQHQVITAMLYLGILCGFVAEQNTLDDPCGSCNRVPVQIERLKYFIFSMNF